ncbi:MAG: hypothetical protein ACO3UU_12255 [Minisyncoccia bacterium]
MATNFSSVCDILGKLYYQYNNDEGFADFIEYNDIGLPLAYLISEKLCEPTQDGEKYVVETWELFLAAVEVEDKDFSSLEEILDMKSNEK